MSIERLWDGENEVLAQRQEQIKEALAGCSVVICPSCGARFNSSEPACPSCGESRERD